MILPSCKLEVRPRWRNNIVDKIGKADHERFALHPLTQYFIRSDITKEWIENG